MGRSDFDWDEEPPAREAVEDSSTYSEIGIGGRILGRFYGLASTGPLRLTLTREEMVLQPLLWPFAMLLGGHREYRFPRECVTGLYFSPGLFNDWAHLHILHSMESYASRVGYFSDHSGRLEAALERLGWDVEPDE